MSPTMNTQYTLAGCFPRVSGDEPAYADTAASTVGFSPRERG